MQRSFPQTSDKIAIYHGSFDPPHRGHQEVVQYCLAKSGCSKVYIVANEPNRHKPSRLDYPTRKAMLEIMFKDQLQVVIVDSDTIDLISAFRKLSVHTHIIGVMGSDGALLIKDKKSSPEKFAVDEWLIIPRAADANAELPESIDEKKTTIAQAADFCEQQYSSTEIRKYFAEHDSFFTNPVALTTTPLPMRVELLQYIKLLGLYRNERAAILSFLNVHRHMMSDNVLLSSLKEVTQQLGGLSGDTIYFLQNTQGENVLVIKSFHSKNRERDLQYEVTAIKKLQTLNLKLSSPINHFFYSCEPHYAFLAMEVVQGNQLKNILSNIKDKSSPEYPDAKQLLKQSVTLYAQALAELHVANVRPIVQLSSNEIKYYTDKMQQIYISIQVNHAYYPTLDLALLFQYIEKTTQAFLQHPGCYSYTHGDPNLANFFIHLQESRVIMIDTAHLAGKWMDAEANPKGFAANEFFEANSAIWLCSQRLGLPEEEIAELQTTFTDAYVNFAPKQFATNEALRFFHLFWLFRAIFIPLRSLESYTGRKEFESDPALLGNLIAELKMEIGQVEITAQKVPENIFRFFHRLVNDAKTNPAAQISAVSGFK